MKRTPVPLCRIQWSSRWSFSFDRPAMLCTVNPRPWAGRKPPHPASPKSSGEAAGDWYVPEGWKFVGIGGSSGGEVCVRVISDADCSWTPGRDAAYSPFPR